MTIEAIRKNKSNIIYGILKGEGKWVHIGRKVVVVDTKFSMCFFEKSFARMYTCANRQKHSKY